MALQQLMVFQEHQHHGWCLPPINCAWGSFGDLPISIRLQGLLCLLESFLSPELEPDLQSLNICCFSRLYTNYLLEIWWYRCFPCVVLEVSTRPPALLRSEAPIKVTFLDVLGARTGKIFPTGHRSELIDGVRVTCIDSANPVVLMHFEQLGLETGHEAVEERSLGNDSCTEASVYPLQQSQVV